MTIRLALKATRASKRREMIGSFFLRGGRRITAGSTGSTPNDCDGGPSAQDQYLLKTREGISPPSIRMLMNRICIALSGFDSPSSVLSVMRVSAAAAVLSWNERKFWMLWKMLFPAHGHQSLNPRAVPKATHPPPRRAKSLRSYRRPGLRPPLPSPRRSPRGPSRCRYRPS
jgi:hypothetical protein